MMARVLYSLALAALLGVNVWLGTGRIMGFIHRYQGEESLAVARLDDAYASFEKALEWERTHAFTHVLLGRVIHLSQANGVTPAAHEGQEEAVVSAAGVSAIIRGISISPADALGWFNLAQAYRGYRIARTRIDRLKAMVEAIKAGKSPREAREAVEGTGLRPEDLMSIVATTKARQLEPKFSFYHDFLAKLYWDRKLPGEAADEIRAGYALTPQVNAHPWASDKEFIHGLAEAILAGLDAAASNRWIHPLAVMLARAETLEALGRHDEAMAAYGVLKKEGTQDIRRECNLRMAKIFQLQGDFETSTSLLDRLLEDEPRGRRAASVLYYLGLAHSRLGDPEKAVAYYRRHLTKRVGSPRVLLDLAAELETLGRDGEAEKIYVGLVARTQDDAEPYRRIIRMLTRKRRNADALRYARLYSEKITGSGSAEEILRALGPKDEN